MGNIWDTTCELCDGAFIFGDGFRGGLRKRCIMHCQMRIDAIKILNGLRLFG